MGRPKVKIDWAKVDQMLMAQCFNSEIANNLNVGIKTLQRACKAEHNVPFDQYSRQKRDKGKVHAKQTFYQQAWITDKDPARQIFWTKQHLGWSDRVKNEHQHSGKIDSDVSVSGEVRVLYEVKDNGRTKKRFLEQQQKGGEE